MGQFSFLDCKDGSQILNNTMADVYVLIPAAFGGGHIHESFYDGYGNFGGYDIYELLADWNEPNNRLEGEQKRNHGIDLFFDNNDGQNLKYPVKITHDPNAIYEECKASTDDENQGFYVAPYDENKPMPKAGDDIRIAETCYYVVDVILDGLMCDNKIIYRPYDFDWDDNNILYVYGEESYIWADDFNRNTDYDCETLGAFREDIEIRICGKENPNVEKLM